MYMLEVGNKFLVASFNSPDAFETGVYHIQRLFLFRHPVKNVSLSPIFGIDSAILISSNKDNAVMSIPFSAEKEEEEKQLT